MFFLFFFFEHEPNSHRRKRRASALPREPPTTCFFPVNLDADQNRTTMRDGTHLAEPSGFGTKRRTGRRHQATFAVFHFASRNVLK